MEPLSENTRAIVLNPAEQVMIPQRRTGKLPPKHDAMTLRFATYLQPRKLPPIPKTVDRLSRVMKVHGGFPMLANNRLGDCTCAALDHCDLTAEVWGKHPIISDQEREARTIRRYSRVSGYDPNTGANDNGAYLLDVLKDAQHNGMDGNGNDKIGAYVQIDATNEVHLVAALHVFGVLYTGLMLPISAQSEKVWTRTEGPGSEPYGWGGHAVKIGKITTKDRTCITWGGLQKMTEAWQMRFMDEAWTFIDEDFLRDNKKTVSGFDMAGLVADLQTIRNR